jgi:predicted thioesterase
MTFEHLQPSYAGAEIVTRATVRQVSSRRIELEVESFEGQTLVARATHTRAIAPRAKFLPPSGSTEDPGSRDAKVAR